MMIIAGGRGNALLFDLELGCLETDLQRTVARRLFESFGCCKLTGCETGPRCEVDFGRRVHDAAIAVLKVFSEVFGVPEDANYWIYADFECGAGAM